jgi:hypothetical protein
MGMLAYPDFPLNPEIDPTIRETIATKREGLANIIIYNGATGSLLDNGLRNGKHINFKGMFKKINKDIRDIEANLKAYYIINPNCQVYLCGIVKPFHINFAFHYNNKLKEITKRIPNVTYVEPAPVHVLQNKEGKLAIDIHPNEDKGEYSYINCSIITSIVDNYVSNQVCNDLLNAVKYVGERMTSEKLDSDKGAHLCTELIDAIFTRYYDDKKIDPAMIDKGIEKFRIHYRERYPHYYYYTYKEDVINQASQKIKK